MTQEELYRIESAMNRRLAAMPDRLRPFTTETSDMPKTLLLTGPRGCGKSTYLLHHAKGRRMLYLSVDNPLIVAKSLYDVVSDVFMAGYEGVILDEVHYAADWSLHLKALADDFPAKSIWASDSSALVLRIAVGDLSRRYVSRKMPLMSFREFLFLETGKLYPIYNIGDEALPLDPDSEILDAFRRYRECGTRPFYQEGNFNERYMAVLDKVLDTDIPYFLSHITDDNLRLIRAIVGTLASSSIPRVQVTSLCSDWAVGAEKLYQLLYVMESVQLLRIVRYPNDVKARSVGAKMLFEDACAYHVLHADMGTEREAFVAMCFSQAGYSVAAMKDEKKGDFVISKSNEYYGATAQPFTVEVGGKNKNIKSAQYVLRDNIDYPSSGSVPFWLLGMMW